jgi:hypothetical protein
LRQNRGLEPLVERVVSQTPIEEKHVRLPEAKPMLSGRLTFVAGTIMLALYRRALLHLEFECD